MGKARGMGAGRELKQHMISKRLAYKNSPLGKKRFGRCESSKMGKTRSMAAGRKLKLHMIRQRLSYLDKQRFLEKHLGNEWNKPYGLRRTEAKQHKTPVFLDDDWWKNIEEIGPVMRDIPGLRYKLIKYKGVWVKALIMGKI